MPKLYNEKVRDVAGALRHEGVGPAEIMRRLNEDEAGLGFAVPIKIRQVNAYISDYNRIHGKPLKVGQVDDPAVDTTARLKHRIKVRMEEEIAAIERRRKGSLTVAQDRSLKQLYATLDDIERREEAAAKRRGRGRSAPSTPAKNGQGDSKSTSALEALAEKQREGQGENGHGDDEEREAARAWREGSDRS